MSLTTGTVELIRLITDCLPMSLTTGAVELLGELNNCSVNR